jgi:hypothetical protein
MNQATRLKFKPELSERGHIHDQKPT